MLYLVVALQILTVCGVWFLIQEQPKRRRKKKVEKYVYSDNPVE